MRRGRGLSRRMGFDELIAPSKLEFRFCVAMQTLVALQELLDVYLSQFRILIMALYAFTHG